METQPTFASERDRVLARFARPTADGVTLAVVSDVHVSSEETGTWKVFHRTESRLATAVADANRLGLDGVVFAGDLTKDGSPAEFAAVDSLLDELAVPYVAVPGNHDVPKSFDPHETPALDAFVESYTPGSLPFRTRFGGVDVIGLNSAAAPDGSLEDTHGGRISDDQIEWLDATVEPDRPTVVVLHHPIFSIREHVPTFSDSDHLQLANAAAVNAALARNDVDLVVSGHVHWPAAARVDGVSHLTTPAGCSFPPAYLLFDVSPGGTSVSLVPLADEAGAREAVDHAARDGARDGTLLENAEGGYFDAFPLVDEAGIDPRAGSTPTESRTGLPLHR
ncbi:metallophosphoesterase family protein [Halomarina halobia]|uniref:Metallophosphoesterase family protein n=1 Tax=Halomarina halobia TaxID=3033386 RepID=A0ABD6A9N5_9EURY|nr:metallophosphoesterase [Halomarina sp. PSR21]